MAAAPGQFGNLDTFPANNGFIGNDGTNFYTTVCFPAATTAGSTLLLHCGVYPGTGPHLTGVSDPANGSWGSPLETVAPSSSGNSETSVYAKQNAASIAAGSQGQCTAASATTLTDSSKTWTTNQWAGKTLLDLNTGATHTVTSNTATVLTFPSGTAPTSGDFYVVGSFIKITLNTSASIFYNFAQCVEITGAATSGTIVHASQDVTFPSGTSNGISSGTASCTVPGLLVGFSVNVNGSQSAPYSPSVDTGGGFTLLDFYFVADNGPSTATGATTEYQHFASAPGTKAATFGVVSSTTDCPTFMVFVPDAGAPAAPFIPPTDVSAASVAKKQIGAATLGANLLLTTLAVVASLLPQGAAHLTGSAPVTRPSVRQSDYQNRLPLIATPIPLPLGYSQQAFTPQQKRQVFAENRPSLVVPGIKAPPAVAQLSTPATFPKNKVQADQPLGSPLTLGLQAPPPTGQLAASAPILKTRLTVDNPVVPLTVLGQVPLPSITTVIWSFSAPIIRQSVYAENRGSQLPIGIQAPPSVGRQDGSAPAGRSIAAANVVSSSVLPLTQVVAVPATIGFAPAPQSRRVITAEQLGRPLTLVPTVAPQGIPLPLGQPYPPVATPARPIDPLGFMAASVVGPAAPPPQVVTSRSVTTFMDAPRTKRPVMADQFANRLTIAEPIAPPLGYPQPTLLVQRKREVQAEQYVSRLPLGVTPAPAVTQLTTSAPAIRRLLLSDYYGLPSTLTLTPPPAPPPPAIPPDFSRLQTKYQVHVDVMPLPTALMPIPVLYTIDGAAEVDLAAYGRVFIYSDGNGHFFTIG